MFKLLQTVRTNVRTAWLLPNCFQSIGRSFCPPSPERVVILSSPFVALTDSQKKGESRICDRIGDIVLKIVQNLSETCIKIVVPVHPFSLMSVQLSVQLRYLLHIFNL